MIENFAIVLSEEIWVTDELKVGEPRCIVASGDKCGEGILWDAASASVFWTDINRFLVHRFRTADKATNTWFFSEPVTCVLPTTRTGVFVLVLGSGAILWEPEGDVRHPPFLDLPNWPQVRCNDAAIDPEGSLWVGTMRNNVREDGDSAEAGGLDGILYRIDPDGHMSEWKRDITISNTLAWGPDSATFYFGDSLKNEIFSYAYDAASQSIANAKPFFCGFERGLPDGSAIDDEGYLWNCRYGGNCIVRIAPDGTVDRVIELPIANPTNCTFGGPQRNTLFFTCAAPEAGTWERFGGCLFAIETNVSGPLSFAFKLDKN